MATNTTTKKSRGVGEAVADAVVEVGEAMRELQRSWDHLRRARAKSAPATRAIARMGKRTYRTTSRMTKRAVRKVRGKR